MSESNATKTIDILAIGEILIDFVQKDTNEQGYPVLSAYPGGAPGNFLAVGARHGLRCEMLSRVGDDSFGHLLKQTLSEVGVGTELVAEDPDCFTTLAFVTLDETGNRSFSFARKPGADTRITLDDRAREMIKKTRCLHFGSLSLCAEPARTATMEAVALAKESGAWINYDPNYRDKLWPNPAAARREMLWGITQADSIKLSEEELEFLFDDGDGEYAAMRRLASISQASVVSLTRGERGVTIFILDKSRPGHWETATLPAFTTDRTIDTTGAGDIFGGALMVSMLAYEGPISEIGLIRLIEGARYASATAAISTTKHGGIPSIPDPEETKRLLERAELK